MDDVLIELGLMQQHGIHRDLHDRTLKTKQEEIVMSTLSMEETIRKVTLCEDHLLPARSESTVKVKVYRDDDCEEINLIEPDMDNGNLIKRVLLAKTLTRERNSTVYVRMVNLKESVQQLKKGEVVGIAQTVTYVSRCEDVNQPTSRRTAEEFPDSLKQLEEKSRALR